MAIATARQLTFNSFCVTPANRDAFEACRAVAERRAASTAPLVLFGPPGGGKSHLIWAILNEVRASAARAGIALVLAREFPLRVRQLLQDPAPLRRGQPILLLVDELEQFRDDAQDLEAVVRLFHAEAHPIIIASNVHPARLGQFSEAFRGFLQEARLMEVVPLGAGEAVDLDALQAELEQLRAENAQLKGDLERATHVEAELADARQALERGAASRGELEERIAQLEDQCRELEQDRSMLQKQVAAQAPLQQELVSVRKLFADAEADAEAALAQQARLQGQLSAMRLEVEEARRARDEAAHFQELVQTEAQTLVERFTAARGDAARQHQAALETLQTVIQDMDLCHAAHEEIARLRARIDETQTQASTYAITAAERDDLRAELELARAELAHLEELVEEARADRGRQKVTLDSAVGRIRGLQSELEKSHKQISVQSAEMDALRQEAAGQVASAHVQAGELEHDLAQYRTAWQAMDDVRNAARADIRDVQRLTQAGLAAVERLATRMSHILQLQPKPAIPAPSAPNPELDLFEALPELPSPDTPG
ncbi:MAG: AAA family ATPase [Candidatus Hydrogenedentes bacterium]|nr:AAA family ATPase [Candidatus Hydrogenedentota bacterium]MBI3118827.1 AAA family ATPase [Candidatus Hydrogenedentota bacterium]